jgi:hypothetical protein
MSKNFLEHIESIYRNKLKANSASCWSYYTVIIIIIIIIINNNNNDQMFKDCLLI